MLQACLNGARNRDFHAAVPFSPEDIAREAVACRATGAQQFHIHPRNSQGLETFEADAVTEALLAIRQAVPGMAVGLSTREGILADPAARQAAFAAWSVLPDYVSVNLSEADAPDVIRQMMERGIGIEAGLATLEDAQRFVLLPEARHCLRILIEIEEQEVGAARKLAHGIITILDDAALKPPRQLHGFDATQWPLYEEALRLGLEQRIGLEDGRLLPDGRISRGNAEMIAAAVALAKTANAPK